MTEVEEIVRKAKIGRWLLVAVVAGTCFVTVYLFYASIQQGKEITQVQHSACQADPAGQECQTAKAESSEAANLHVTCIPFFKAGYPCPKPGSTAAERQAVRQGQAGSGAAQELNSGSDGRGAPASGGSGEAPAPGNGSDSSPSAPPKSTGPRHHPPSAPQEGGGEPAPAPAPEPQAPTASDPAQPSPTGAITAPESAAQPGLIQSTVEGVDEAITPTVCGAAELLRHLCS
jgi:hypothetical protein